jgi:hypothetical protein
MLNNNIFDTLNYSDVYAFLCNKVETLFFLNAIMYFLNEISEISKILIASYDYLNVIQTII